MGKSVSYSKIGIFIISGCILFMGTLIMFGAGKFFEKTIIMETYFGESVQGIDIGTPIKFRGVTIGEVQDIGIVSDWYHVSDETDFARHNLFVVVRGKIDAKRFSLLSDPHKKARLKTLINEQGLRVKLAPLGITGLSYIELDFVDPRQNPPLQITWEPQGLYIPSSLSTIKQLSESLTEISKAINQDLIPLLKNLNSSSQHFPEIARYLKSTLQELQEAGGYARQASKEFPEITSKLNKTLDHINEILSRDKNDVAEVIENIRLITGDLKDITFELKHNPSGTIFGGPPQKKGIKR